MERYKQQLQGLCCVEISGESCANCLTLMPILKELCEARGDVRRLALSVAVGDRFSVREGSPCERTAARRLKSRRVFRVGKFSLEIL
jgi:hypothetical protein